MATNVVPEADSILKKLRRIYSHVKTLQNDIWAHEGLLRALETTKSPRTRQLWASIEESRTAIHKHEAELKNLPSLCDFCHGKCLLPGASGSGQTDSICPLCSGDGYIGGPRMKARKADIEKFFQDHFKSHAKKAKR